MELEIYNNLMMESFEQTLGVLVRLGILDALLYMLGAVQNHSAQAAALRYLQASC